MRRWPPLQPLTFSPKGREGKGREGEGRGPTPPHPSTRGGCRPSPATAKSDLLPLLLRIWTSPHGCRWTRTSPHGCCCCCRWTSSSYPLACKLLSFDGFLKPDCLPAVKTIFVFSCGELMSLSVAGLDGLQKLKIEGCLNKLNLQRVMTLPTSLKKLGLWSCGIESIELDNSQLGSSPVLEELRIVDCPGLKSIGGAAAIDTVKKVNIQHCPQLNEIQQPLCRCLVGTADAETKAWHGMHAEEF